VEYSYDKLISNSSAVHHVKLTDESDAIQGGRIRFPPPGVPDLPG
jgi:hypothetical protein